MRAIVRIMPNSAGAFWTHLETLFSRHRVVFDRPAGSAHPRYPDLIYPFDYGYLDGTNGGDGQGIDIWGGSGDRSVITGVVCTVDLLKSDTEVKLLLGCSEEEMARIVAHHNCGVQAAILVRNSS